MRLPYERFVRSEVKTCAKRGFSVGRLAAVMPTFISTLFLVLASLHVHTYIHPCCMQRPEKERGICDVLLPDIIPAACAGEVALLEEMVLHRCLVDCGCGGQEPERHAEGQAELCLNIDLEFPDYGNRQ